jgi:hypothetical protein
MWSAGRVVGTLARERGAMVQLAAKVSEAIAISASPRTRRR